MLSVENKAAEPATGKPSEVLSSAERAALLQSNNGWGAWLVLRTWLEVFVLLGLAGVYPGVVTTVLVLLLLPGRQLGLAVLMHEAGHGSLFASRRLNNWVGQWLCALPTFGDLPSYAAGHLEHHRKAGTHDDPDLPNYAAYPVSKASFRRKIWRDLSGQTGMKLMGSLLRGGAGNMNRGTPQGRHLLVRQLLAQGVLFLVLASLGWGWTWLLWFGTYMTTYMLVIRLRQLAEHAVVPDLYDLDPRKNTRTVDAPRWQRFLLAPNFVNFHMEHHFMAGVPCYHLPALRQILQDRGYLDDVLETKSYRDVLTRVLLPHASETA